MPLDDREFSRSVASARFFSGVEAELLTAADCYTRGYSVSRPLGVVSRYNLIVDRAGILSKLQVKSASGNSLQARVGWTVYKENIYDGRGSTNYVVRKHTESDFDFLVIVHRPTKMVYYVPVDDLDLSKESFTIKKSDTEKYLAF